MGIWEKLRLEPERHRVVALVGAGGKTSTLYALAREARAAGLTVIVTTTTHIRPHPRLPLTGRRTGRSSAPWWTPRGWCCAAGGSPRAS